MGSIVPMILSAVVGQVFEKDNTKQQNNALAQKLEEIKKRDQITDSERRQKYKSLLASERARIAGSGISSNSGLAGSVLSGLVKRQQQESKNADEISSLSKNSITNKMQSSNLVRSSSRNLLQRVINKV